MCHPLGYSISLTRYRDSLVDDVIAAAHEIGHSLGAPHDDMHSSCTSSEINIMSGTHGSEDHVTQNNDYTFSACSVRAFEKHVTSLEVRGDSKTLSCLYDSIQPLSVSFLLPSLPGQLHDVHRQCQMLYSPSSFFCHIDIGGSENVCSRMPCYNPRTRRCAYHTAGEGTPCGNRKWCIAGACVHSADAPAKHADCVFGNRPGPVYQGQDCDQTLGSKRHLCYSQPNRQVCCDTCLKLATGPPGCEYGNNYWNISSCSPDKCGEPGSQYSRLCCETCQTASTTSATTTTPDLHIDNIYPSVMGENQLTSSNETTVNGTVPPTSSENNEPTNSTDGPAQETSSPFTVLYDEASMGFPSSAPSTTEEGSFISTEPNINISSTNTIPLESVVETTPMVTKRTDGAWTEAPVKSSELVPSREPPTTSVTHHAKHTPPSTPFPPSVTTSSTTSGTTGEPPKFSSTRYLNHSSTEASPADDEERGLTQFGLSCEYCSLLKLGRKEPVFVA
ncbi:cell wall protein RBR3-like [Haliotis rubra]|uniref:cell wall protein RBR3-like n=1 Tax=Haliotis rubra TaxID=36100 RepID=UPI001EE5BF50|nr:cell wall protein RBR3-like [Haliotis rubra]